MDLKIEKANSRGKVDFINDGLVVTVNKKYYKLEYELKDVEARLYSLPDNKYHKPYTIRKNVKCEGRKKAVMDGWSPFKEGMEVDGSIINNKFHVDR